MQVGPICEALRVRGMCAEALKRSKIELREDLRVILQKEIAMSQSHESCVSASIGVSSAKGGDYHSVGIHRGILGEGWGRGDGVGVLYIFS